MNELICALARAASSAADSFLRGLGLARLFDCEARPRLSLAAAADTLSWKRESSAGDMCEEELY